MAIEHVQIRTPMTMTGNVVGAETPIYTVPSGKQLIIEFASMEAALPVGQTARMGIQILSGGAWFAHVLTMSAPTNDGLFTGGHYTSVAQLVRIYADEGQTVQIWVQRSDGSSGSASATLAITGHLIEK
jgi:hypothetical protein